MASPTQRLVTLVLVDAGGQLLGALPPLVVDSPWWQEQAPVTAAVQARDGLRISVLRLLSAAENAPPGGAVTYLAQAESPVPAGLLQPWAGDLPDHPLRHTYARVGGPQADLDWARTVLVAQGIQPEGWPHQVRSWNLSSLWWLPTRIGPVWLKVVPPFFAHEGAVLQALVAEAVPRLLGHSGARMLLAPVPGDDQYGASLPRCLAMIDLLVGIQSRWLGRADALLPLGLPDWRGPALTRALSALVARRAGELGAAPRALLQAMVQGLPARFEAIAACGLPDGLVHGDFHPGNLRGPAEGDAAALTLLDWADSGVGHPLLDQPAFLDRVPAGTADAARAHWARAWQAACPGADVARAASLLAPVAAARQALIYQNFLDQIEPVEHPYHRADVPAWLQRTAQRLQAEAQR